MSDARSGNKKALGRGLDDIVTPPTADVDATESLLKRVQPRHVRPTPPSSSSSTSIPSTSSRTSIAPERDFQRIPNSVTRHAVPARVFRGKSKQVYDYLWSVSRGAIVPSRTVRKSRKEIQKGAGLGSMVTVDAALEHLQSVGMIRVRSAVGSLGGNEYEVLTFEESSPSSTSTSRTPSPTHNLDELDEPDSSSTRTTQTVDFKEQTELPKTSLKTNTLDDDDWLPGLRTAVKGQNLPKLAALLISLVKLLDARTDVSSYDSLLTYYLSKKIAHRGNTAQRRPSEEQFRGGPVAEFSEEELAELRKIEADIRAELEGKQPDHSRLRE